MLAALASLLVGGSTAYLPLAPAVRVCTHQRPAVASPTRTASAAMGVLDQVSEAIRGGGEQASDSKSDPKTAAFTAANDRTVMAYTERVARINDLEDEIEALEDEALAAKTAEFRKRLAAGETEEELLEEAFAVVREAAWRTLDLRHYDVQLVGAMALNDGKLAQMGTGEGKTLVATGAVYLNALSGKGAMVVTVNDYLARRDAEGMGQVYAFLGLSVGLVQSGSDTAARREAYASDVTYVTNSELGFDYLRDNLAVTAEEVVLRRELNYCVVDEGDSVLIDEARVPLIISGKTDAPVDKFGAASKLAAVLERGIHYDVFEKEQTVSLTDKGTRDCEKALAVGDLYEPTNPWASYVSNALKAKELFVKERSYLVQGGEAVIIDEFSGRVMEGRRWGDGLHQAVEAKEGLTVQPETEVVASVTYQSLFRRFRKLSSMSGTALSEAEEFATIYGLDVVDVPPVLPSLRSDIPDSVFKTTRGKSNAALAELLSLRRSGRPILVGTTSVEASQVFSDKLTELGVKHEVLSAAPEAAQREAEVVAQAGREGSVTISTNMAGRGTDILLGGNPAFMARLYLRTAFAAAAGLSGVTPPRDGFFPRAVSEEAEAAVGRAAARFAQSRAAAAADDDAEGHERAELAAPDEGCSPWHFRGGFPERRLLAVAASSAAVFEESVEDEAREALEAVGEEFAEELAPEKERVLQAGGLHVIGTNLHDSRRIDGQLRGRAGRQGDPGSTHFFLSLEDRIFRLFGGDKIKGLLDFMRISEDQPLESGQVQRVVEETQAKVLAVQREDTYRTRAAVLRGSADEVLDTLAAHAAGTASDILKSNLDASGAEATLAKLQQFFPAVPLTAADLEGDGAEERAHAAVQEALRAKAAELDSVRPGLAVESGRFLALTQTDTLWKAHMKAMGYVKDFAGLKAYSGTDPIQVYREEGLRLYEAMQTSLRQNTAFSFFQYQPRSKGA
ncbi:hypothetical protein EMIHUDRAFT_466893 [Emiliania huxleyi CCMP1516]|uniref:Protein translocase subunit SecA n=2 Tax=Emiliania huxleyi TaxID=2903 RepID=A0A0D3KRH4_EMIH1|nr:hypothetical protein EMIHUDRAFT_466893 [Emiliania huxleyi CCMP1516]EOD38359.1 hypothetical protein EMIHUDRAFT_466893 [Emiliania huxleyi CCMP1516]|eukprot:XP_005790788.1 hypothetical protein EMIHUDRAFT_466893 [Emiliania huxleyi CCMP1516]